MAPAFPRAGRFILPGADARATINPLGASPRPGGAPPLDFGEALVCHHAGAHTISLDYSGGPPGFRAPGHHRLRLRPASGRRMGHQLPLHARSRPRTACDCGSREIVPGGGRMRPPAHSRNRRRRGRSERQSPRGAPKPEFAVSEVRLTAAGSTPSGSQWW